MKTDDTLGILVNSNQHFDLVLKLAEAATSKGKHVKIHLQGPGTGLVDSDPFEHLLNNPRISISANDFRHSAAAGQHKDAKPLKTVASKKLNRILNECKRHVVF